MDVDRVQLPHLQHNLCIPMVGAGLRSLFSIQLHDMCTRLRLDQIVKQSGKHNQRGKLKIVNSDQICILRNLLDSLA